MDFCDFWMLIIVGFMTPLLQRVYNNLCFMTSLLQRAVELEKKDVGGKSDPYCVVLYGDQKHLTKVQ